MTRRENVVRTMTFDSPDYVPLLGAGDSDFAVLYPATDWTPETMERLAKGEAQPLGVDGVTATPEEAERGVKDPWGCVWVSRDASIGMVREPILDDWSKLAAFKPPDPRDPAKFDCPKWTLERSPDDAFVLGCQLSTLFERLQYLRSPDAAMADLALYPGKVKDLLAILTDWYIEVVDEWTKYGVDAIFMGDDWGSTQGPLVSRGMWQDIFQPYYARINEAAHQRGLFTFLHSCGHIFDLIEDMIDAGFDGVNSYQMRLFGIERSAARYGGRVTFMLSADIMTTMATGTPDEVRQETRQIIDAFKGFGGGLIGIGYGFGVPPENNEAGLRTFREYGRY